MYALDSHELQCELLKNNVSPEAIDKNDKKFFVNIYWFNNYLDLNSICGAWCLKKNSMLKKEHIQRYKNNNSYLQSVTKTIMGQRKTITFCFDPTQ